MLSLESSSYRQPHYTVIRYLLGQAFVDIKVVLKQGRYSTSLLANGTYYNKLSTKGSPRVNGSHCNLRTTRVFGTAKLLECQSAIQNSLEFFGENSKSPQILDCASHSNPK